MNLWQEKLYSSVTSYLNFILKTRAVWLRGLFCFFVSLVVLFLEQNSFHDFRFKLRGKQSIDASIVLLEIPTDEWSEFLGNSSLSFSSVIPDSYFWKESFWEKSLKKIIDANPKSIAVSFYFGKQISTNFFSKKSIFFHPKIIWATQIGNSGELLATKFGKKNNKGLISFNKDRDGVIRQILSPEQNIPHLSVRLIHPNIKLKIREDINFRGPSGSFLSMNLMKLDSYKNLRKKIEGKFVIIGPSGGFSHHYRTAAGQMTRSELLANASDNLIHKSWIKKMNTGLASFFLLLLVFFCIWIVSSYPRSYSFILMCWIGIASIATSFWLFDAFNYWTPILATITLLVFIYIVFLSYQLTMKESLTWTLRQQHKYYLEAEELKNNFVSLISHDLKTPIAKMQAICDRLLSESTDENTSNDLKTLRNESSELHKYIQSILQITRVESRNLKLNRKSTDINKLINITVKQLDELSKEKYIEIHLNLEPIFLLEVDELLVQQVILNIIENAIKYTPENGKIHISSQEVDDNIFVRVKDNGVGIEESDKDLIFEKFYRSKNANQGVKGSGLGLYLSKYFIELHGGSVFLESEKGHGTTVGFNLSIS